MRDVLSAYEHVSIKNHVRDQKDICLNSANSFFGADADASAVLNRIKSEFDFFDPQYWHNRSKASINLIVRG
jgi:hypothetical protein